MSTVPKNFSMISRSWDITRTFSNVMGSPALQSVKEEFKKRRKAPTILESSGVDESQANGAAERVAQALGEQVRVVRQGLEARLGNNMRSYHSVLAWMVEHAADVISKYEVGTDGRTVYERMKGNPCSHEIVEFGEHISSLSIPSGRNMW